MLALAGDVAGRQILDAGCGSGHLFAAPREGGAIVTGFDASTGMLEMARRRLGDDARVWRANAYGGKDWTGCLPGSPRACGTEQCVLPPVG
jgi:trans-aconitate methyltransferase